MRKELMMIGKDERHTFTGTFERFGVKNGYMGCPEDTVLLVDVCDEGGSIVAEHLWFNCTKGFDDLDLKQGDIVKFNARVASYRKGYFGRRRDVYVPFSVDYKLSYPTKIKKINCKEEVAKRIE